MNRRNAVTSALRWMERESGGKAVYMEKGKLNWKKHVIGLLISIAIAEGVGLLSAFFTRDTMQDYMKLLKPPFSPPGWVFPVVWGILYLLMGVASYIVYSKGIEKTDVKVALIFYVIQLVFNFFWSIIFFRFQARGFAYIWIIALLALVILTTVKFFKVSKVAGWLMVPYILWVFFASILNYSVWQLNR